jgi:hypothetical protein
MRTNDAGHVASAVAALAARDYERAGDEYARAGWRVLAEPRDGQSPFDADEKGWIGQALAHHTASALSYRVAGRSERASRRAVEGVAVARDLKTGLDHPVQRACLGEFVADFRVAGGLDGASAAYDAAADAYRDAASDIESPQTWGTTPLFEAAASAIKQVARGQADGEIAVAWEDLHGGDPSDRGAFLAARAAFKRQRFPAFVERAVADGHLAAPRGTTEYATDHHECPHCGSTHVNWVGDSTLCLVCSRPTEEQ